MDPDQYSRVKAIYQRALELPEQERSAFVAGECDSDADLREVMSLLGQPSTPLIDGEVDGSNSERAIKLDAERGSGHDPMGVVGHTIDERYRVESFAAEGGFSYVYRAHHVAWNRDVAVKFFKPMPESADPEKLKASFLREGSLVNELSTKTSTIVRSYDVGSWTTPGGVELLFTVLEWLEGETLAQLLDRERASVGRWGWPMERVISVMSPIAEALRIAHEHGVAHRDIKPSNIHIGPEHTKLLDFGVAKDTGRTGGGFEHTSTQAGAFSVAYAAPEQLDKASRPTGPWTDVYGLAIVCVELLVGRHPIEGSDLLEIIDKARDRTHRPTPRAAQVNVTGEIEQVFEKALAVDPSGRHRDVEAFWKMLSSTTANRGHASEGGGRVRDRPQTSGQARTMVPAVGLALLCGIVGTTLVKDAVAPPVVPAAAVAAVAPERRGLEPNHLAGFGPLPVAAHAPGMTEEKIALGRQLYWDPLLSQDGDLSCVSCHQLGAYGIDHRAHSVGHRGREHARNTPSVFNMAQAFSYLWDGRVTNLDELAKVPLFSPVVMGTNEADLMERLHAEPQYAQAFEQAFPGDEESLTVDNLSAALGAFLRQLYTPGPWDRYLTGDTDAVTDQELEGFRLFVDTGCVSCHHGPFVGLTGYQRLGLMVPWPRTHDTGRFKVTGHESDLMTFRVPSLRNVAKTAPYFHDGSVKSLEQAIAMMARHQLGKTLSTEEIGLIKGWLETLTGKLPRHLTMPPEPLRAQ